MTAKFNAKFQTRYIILEKARVHKDRAIGAHFTLVLLVVMAHLLNEPLCVAQISIDAKRICVEFAKKKRDCTMSQMDEYGRHEAMHMASFLCQSVGSELCEHPQVKSNPEWSALAEAAMQSLFDLYQAIGMVHLGEENSK